MCISEPKSMLHPPSPVLDEQAHGTKRDVDRVPILDLQATLNVQI